MISIGRDLDATYLPHFLIAYYDFWHFRIGLQCLFGYIFHLSCILRRPLNLIESLTLEIFFKMSSLLRKPEL